MDGQNGAKWFKYLAGYYAILQASHLVFLVRAGLILQQTGRVPFPASPPSGGWHPSVIPFLMGMASADALAAILGVYFSYSFLVKGLLKPLTGIISLSIALSSAVVYLFGTLPAGAWGQNPVSYLIVLLAFSPILPFYYLLVRHTNQAMV